MGQYWVALCMADGKKEATFSLNEHSIIFPDTNREVKAALRNLSRSEPYW